MAFTKGMKKGLSVLLSLAMVVTSVSVNGKTADAEAGDLTVTVTGKAAEKVAGSLEVSVAVEEGTSLVADNLTVSVVKMKDATTEDGNADGFTATKEVNSEDETKFDVALAVAGTVAAGQYKVKAEYGSKKGEAVFNILPQYSVTLEKTKDGNDVTAVAVDTTAEKVTVKGTVTKWDGGQVTGSDIELIGSDQMTVPTTITVDDGEFEADVALKDLEENDFMYVTAKVKDTDYSDTVYVRVKQASGVYAVMNYCNDGWWDGSWGPDKILGYLNGTPAQNAAKMQSLIKDITKAGTYTIEVTTENNFYQVALIDFKDAATGSNKEEYLKAFVDKITIDEVKLDDEAVEKDEACVTGVFFGDDGFRLSIINRTNDEDSYCENNAKMPTAKKLSVKFTVAEDLVKPEGSGTTTTTNEAITTTGGAVAASVTGITMAPKAITATAGAATTKAAVLTVSGSALNLLAVNNVTVSAVSTSGITVALTTKAAVTATAAAATFDAVVTVPASCATGDYVLVASAGAVTASVATVSVIAAEAPVEEDVHTTKLVVKTANGTNKVTMGVGETAKIKVNKKPAKSVDAVTAKSAKAKVVKASMKGKNLVLKAKKVGKAKVTLTSGTVTKKITVTVMKAPKKLTLKDGKKAAKKTVKLNAKTKKNVTKKYKVVLPKKTASYGYTTKISGKKAVIKKAAVTTNKKGVQTLVVTVKKKSKGSAKIVVTSAANKKAKATVKVKASK